MITVHVHKNLFVSIDNLYSFDNVRICYTRFGEIRIYQNTFGIDILQGGIVSFGGDPIKQFALDPYLLLEKVENSEERVLLDINKHQRLIRRMESIGEDVYEGSESSITLCQENARIDYRITLSEKMSFVLTTLNEIGLDLVMCDTITGGYYFRKNGRRITPGILKISEIYALLSNDDEKNKLMKMVQNFC